MCRRSPRWTTTRRARSPASTARAARSSASSRSSGARSSPTRRSRRSSARPSSRPRTSEFEQHFGLSIPRIVAARSIKDIIERRKARGRQHAHAAARAQAVPRRDEQERLVERKIKEAHPRHPDREALHQARNLHALLQPDVLRPRRLRRRGRRAAVLRQVREGSDRRRGGDDRRDPPGRARRARTSTWTPRCGAATTRCSGWRRRATSRRRTPTTPTQEADRRRATPASAAIRSRRISSRRSARSSRARYGAKQLYENGLSIQTGARRQAAGGGEPRAGRRAAPDRQAARVPQAAPEHARGRPDDRDLQTPALGPADGGRTTSSRQSSTDCGGAAIQLRAGALHVIDRSEGLRLDRQDAPARNWSRRRPRRNAAAHSRRRPRTPRPARSSRRRWSRARCWRSTTAPARSAR